MEAEEPHTTMDAEKHPSSKDPSAEDSQEPLIPDTPLESSISHIALEPHTAASQTMPSTSHTELETYISENPLEPSVSETPLEPPTSESQMMSPTSHTELETYIPENPLEPSIPETPLELNTSESQMMPPTSQTPLETYTSETLLEPSISKASLEHSKVPEDLTLYNSSPDHVSDALKTGLSSEISWPGSSTQIRESEILPEYSLLDPSAKVHLDTFAEERKEEGEDKEGEDATVSTTHTAQPGRHLGDTASPVVLAKQAELVEVPEAMQREKCGAHVNNPFQWEKNAALKATQTGLYIGWRCPHYLWDCFRIGDESKCFCGHLLREHRIISDISVPCNVSQCRCLMFCFIPSSPEEVGEFWLKRRATFDPKAWRAQCRCKHSHENHAATGCHPCRVKGCCCYCFESNFLCAACDRRWEEHETFFETEETRRRGGRPRGTDTVNSWHRPV
ncbi:PREDICTED: protein FAM221B [Myotis brandtii]|uniref:protein FAM221B n=1 Tax=Myotis brandtii TaxID=109478 RepID=UPI000703D0AF|nr:PREDICTED: protein FAM221B [Myotis brandtii]